LRILKEQKFKKAIKNKDLKDKIKKQIKKIIENPEIGDFLSIFPPLD